jgi:hypothetical protein
MSAWQRTHRATSALALVAALCACERSAGPSASLLASCERTALLNDYDSVRAVTFDPASRAIALQAVPSERVVAQAAVNCAPRSVIIATNFPPGDARRASVTLVADEGRRSQQIPEGINGIVLHGSDVLVVTAQQKRASVDQEIGALTSKEVDRQTGEHLFTELLVLDQALREKRRLRYPMPAYEWIRGDAMLTVGPQVISLDLRTGKRRQLYDFSSTPDFPFAIASFHLVGGTLFAVIGQRAPHPTSLPLGALLRLDEDAKTWDVLSRDLPSDASLAVDDGTHLTVFGTGGVKVFDKQGKAVVSGQVPAPEGLQVRAAAPLKDAMLVLLMRPSGQGAGTFDSDAVVVALASDLTLIASTTIPDVGSAPMLSSGQGATPSGGRYGFLGPMP